LGERCYTDMVFNFDTESRHVVARHDEDTFRLINLLNAFPVNTGTGLSTAYLFHSHNIHQISHSERGKAHGIY
jgi:hypothetical protein